MELYLLKKIETLRCEMIKQALKCGNLTHEAVISVSQQLDKYIVLYQKLRYGRLKLKTCGSQINAFGYWWAE